MSDDFTAAVTVIKIPAIKQPIKIKTNIPFKPRRRRRIFRAAPITDEDEAEFERIVTAIVAEHFAK